MVDPYLCHQIREYLEKGYTLQHVHKVLAGKGRSQHDINVAINEFFKDEATKFDDKLIRKIETRFRKSKSGKPKLLQDIFAGLVNEGYKPFEVEKAMLRAKFTPKLKVKTVMIRWEAYSIIQIVVLITTVLLAVFYKLIFIVPVFFIFLGMAAASMGVPKIHDEWRKEFGMIPGIGLWTRDGIFGYNATTGNYWRFRVLDPALYVSGIFIIIAFFSFIYLGYGLFFSLICLYLAILSGLSFTMKAPDTSGPPYSPLFRD